MPDVTRFAGYPSPGNLLGDQHLTRKDKIDALQSWRALVMRAGIFEAADPIDRKRLIGEIARALDRLRRE